MINNVKMDGLFQKTQCLEFILWTQHSIDILNQFSTPHAHQMIKDMNLMPSQLIRLKTSLEFFKLAEKKGLPILVGQVWHPGKKCLCIIFCSYYNTLVAIPFWTKEVHCMISHSNIDEFFFKIETNHSSLSKSIS